MSDSAVAKPEVVSIGAPASGDPEALKEALADAASLAHIDPKLLNLPGVDRHAPILPGYNGVPFYGPADPLARESDPPKDKPKIGASVKIEILDTSNVEHMKHLQDVWQLHANGYGQVLLEERMYDPPTKSWRVFLRWMTYVSFMPNGK